MYSNASTFKKYNLVYNYAILALTGDDILPQSYDQVLVALLYVMSGPMLIGILIGNFTDIVYVLTSNERKKNDEVDMIETLMFGLQLPENIQNRVNEYYDMISDSTYFIDSKAFEMLNETMRDSIIMYKAEKSVSKIPFIKNTADEQVKALLLHLEIEYFQSGDLILKQGEIGHKF